MSASTHIYRPGIDGLRAVSVLMVALYHAFPDSLPGGFLGVDVFFVISGYLITQLLMRESQQSAQGKIDLGAFYLRRLRRLAPAFLLTSGLVLLIGLMALDPLALIDLGGALAASMVFGVNWLFYLGADYFNPAQEQNLLLHAWSLAVEEQFYLVWPLLIMAFARTLRTLLMVLIGLSLVSLVWALWAGLAGAHQGAFFGTHLRVWELGAGGLLALSGAPVLRVLSSAPYRRIVMGAGLAGLVLAGVLTGPLVPRPGLAMLLPVIAALACLLAAESAGRTGQQLLGLGHPVLAYLGRLSYPFYLLHWPALVALGLFVHDPEDGHRGLVLMLALGVSALVYHQVEKPIRNRQILVSARKLVLVCAGLALVLGGAGILLARSDGLPGRIPEAALAALEVGMDERGEGRDCAPLSALATRTSGLTEMAQRYPELRACVLGDAGVGPIATVLWGDSHLLAIESAAGRAAQAQGLKVLSFAQGACPPLLNAAWSGLAPAQAQACAEHNAAVAELLQLLQPAHITLVGHWDVYAPRPGGLFGLGGAQGKLRAVGVEDRGAGLFEARLADTLAALPSSSQITLLLDVPTHAFSTPHAVALKLRHPWMPEPGWIRRSEQVHRRQGYEPAMRSVLADRNGILVDPLEAFCETERCLGMIGEAPAYFDANHLSAVGADHLLAAHPELLSGE